MSLAEQPESPKLLVLPPKEALRRATPLPNDDDLELVDVTDEEWDAFEQALAGR